MEKLLYEFLEKSETMVAITISSLIQHDSKNSEA